MTVLLARPTAPLSSEDVWCEQDTSPDAIDAALRRLLRERHAANRAVAPARVLNLVVIVDRECKREIANRLAHVARYHASRTILCSVEVGRTTLDAHAVMSYPDVGDGAFAVTQETVEIDLGPRHLSGLDTIIDPVVISDLPTILWSPHGHEPAVRALTGRIDAVLLDSDEGQAAHRALKRAADLTRSAHVVDLAWLRTTPWRERLAASFDLPERLTELRSLTEVSIRHPPGLPASALLLAGWLAARLEWQPTALTSRNGSLRGTVGTTVVHGGVEIALEPVDQDVPGIAGVTVSVRNGFSIAFDRARGGLCVRERTPLGNERTWQALGASRGENGILGEGVRQALLRDPTYGPALGAVRELWPS